mmetsp:Transcript_37287/g.90516  ORF Transcript_37287/g.90516 Transcript_37287/m.90516 type:complete len:82 (-) Transcript_37287:87-332(-)
MKVLLEESELIAAFRILPSPSIAPPWSSSRLKIWLAAMKDPPATTANDRNASACGALWINRRNWEYIQRELVLVFYRLVVN